MNRTNLLVDEKTKQDKARAYFGDRYTKYYETANGKCQIKQQQRK